MTAIEAFPINDTWPAEHTDRLQLYSLPTPNGVKISIALEELGLPYEAHRIAFGAEGTGSAPFATLNPNGKIPAIIDPDGPDGKPIALFESGAILVYLAEKAGRLIPDTAHGRYETLQWVMFQMGGIGPMFGQLEFFHLHAGSKFEDKRPEQRYVNEAKRLLGVLDQRLSTREFMLDWGYSIADIALIGWTRKMKKIESTREITEFDRFGNVDRWLEQMLARPAVQRGLTIPAADKPSADKPATGPSVSNDQLVRA